MYVLNIVMLGGKSAVLWSQIMLYRGTSAEPCNVICDHKTDNLYDIILHTTWQEESL